MQPTDDATTTPPAAPPVRRQRAKRRKLEPYHRTMLEAVCEGLSLRQAAAKCGVAPRSAQRWALRHGEELRHARASLLDSALGTLFADLSAARSALREMVEIPGAAAQPGASVRRAAAEALVSIFEKLVRIGDTDQRLSALERALAPEAPTRRGTLLALPALAPRAAAPSTAAAAALPQGADDVE